MTQAVRIQSAILFCSAIALTSCTQAGITECRPCSCRAVSFESTTRTCGACSSSVSTDCSPSSGCGQWIEHEYVVHKPTWVNETRTVSCTEYTTQEQVRECVERVPYREAHSGTRETCRTVYKRVRQTCYVSVPYQVRQRGYQPQLQLVTVPVTRWYCVVVPQTETREEVRTNFKPVTTRRKESYSVLVKGHEIRQGTRTVCRTISEQRPVECTIMVPFVETREGTRSVCRRVAVTEMQSVAAPSPCGCHETSCQNCQSASANCVSADIPVVRYVTEEHVEPYTYTVRGCRPETQVRMETVCRTVPIREAFSYTVPVWHQERRQRTVRSTSYLPVQQRYRYQVTSYRTHYEPRTTYESVWQWVNVPVEYTVTKYRMEPRERIVRVAQQVPVREHYTYHVTKYRDRRTSRTVKVQVPVTVRKEVQVRVCRTIPTTEVRRTWVPDPCGHVVNRPGITSACDSCESTVPASGPTLPQPDHTNPDVPAQPDGADDAPIPPQSDSA